jgi:hypothetical protein
VEEQMIRSHAPAAGAGEASPAPPRLSDKTLAAFPHATEPPPAHTAQEITALVQMLRTAGAATIAIGHGRHQASWDTAHALQDSWAATGRSVLNVVSWPEQAASWLKPARQLVGSHPDAWVIIDNPAGCAQLAERLSAHPDWTATRTFGTASLDNADAAALTGFGVLTGMRGVSRDGSTWRIGHGLLLRDSPAVPARGRGPFSAGRRQSPGRLVRQQRHD